MGGDGKSWIMVAMGRRQWQVWKRGQGKRAGFRRQKFMEYFRGWMYRRPEHQFLTTYESENYPKTILKKAHSSKVPLSPESVTKEAFFREGPSQRIM